MLTKLSNENYPNLIIAFNNDPAIQKIAIQNNTAAFKEINTVSNIIQETLEEELKPFNLSFYTEPIYDKLMDKSAKKFVNDDLDKFDYKRIKENLSKENTELKFPE